MIGVFDSGKGGLFALSKLRRLKPDADIVFLADTENAPYGTKTEDELIRLVTGDMERLICAGAEKILIACCTASTVYGKLSSEHKKVAVPIIEPTARRAALITRTKRIGILSTEATKKSLAFVKALHAISPDAAVCAVAAPELVTLAESGERDGSLTKGARQIIEKTINPFRKYGIDTLILGCTHFAYFEREIQNILGVATVNSAVVGAEEIAKITDSYGGGTTVYLS
ncbi:MAG: glutamate racemase [Clostridia bacterium]|nr:glutamate racemase [Clostridia bacterium]